MNKALLLVAGLTFSTATLARAEDPAPAPAAAAPTAAVADSATEQAPVPASETVAVEPAVTAAADEGAAPAAEAPASEAPASVPAAAPAAAPSDLSGWWSGTWLSHHNGHNGPINGYFWKLDEDHYCVHFEGRFWELFPFEYDVVLTVTERRDGSLTMSGSKNLGFIFGTFHYTATVTDTCFVSSYCSKDDHGVFQMSRCCR